MSLLPRRETPILTSESNNQTMKTIFSVHGPIVVPYYQGRGGRTITDDNVKEFWKKNNSFGKLRGCYVFGMRAAKGLTPGYVGKATKSFKQEVFSPHKLAKYQQFCADYLKGPPHTLFSNNTI